VCTRCSHDSYLKDRFDRRLCALPATFAIRMPVCVQQRFREGKHAEIGRSFQKGSRALCAFSKKILSAFLSIHDVYSAVSSRMNILYLVSCLEHLHFEECEIFLIIFLTCRETGVHIALSCVRYMYYHSVNAEKNCHSRFKNSPYKANKHVTRAIKNGGFQNSAEKLSHIIINMLIKLNKC